MALPLVLGGITLAAISYGMKKHYEKKDDPWGELAEDIGEILDQVDEKVSDGLDRVEELFGNTPKSNILYFSTSHYHEVLSKFQTERLIPFADLLAQIKHAPFEIASIEPMEEQSDSGDRDTEVKQETVIAHLQLINAMEALVLRYQGELERIIAVSDDYRAYKETTKSNVDEAIQLVNAGIKLSDINLIDAEGSIDESGISLIKEIKTLIDQKKEDWC